MSSSTLKLLAVLLILILGGVLAAWVSGALDEPDSPHAVFGATGPERHELAGTDAPQKNSLANEPELDAAGRTAVDSLRNGSELENGELDTSLRGRALDPNGSPIRSARVLVARNEGWLNMPLGTEEIMGVNDWRKSYETTTDDEGRFRFEELSSNVYGLEIRHSAFAMGGVDELSYKKSEGLDVGDVIMRVGARLRGRVLDSKGRPVGGATLLESLGHPTERSMVSLPGRGCPLGVSRKDGSFEFSCLDPGPLHLIVDSPFHLPTEVEAKATDPSEPIQDVVVHLEPGFALQGKLVGASPERLSILRVLARRSDSEGEGLSQTEIALANRPRIAICDANGDFELTGLAPGIRYRLTAFEVSEETGRISKRLPEIEPVYAKVGDKNVVLSLKTPSSLTFRVVDDKTGEPITKFEARAGFDQLRPLKRGGEVVTEHPDGVVRFANLRMPKDSEGARINVRCLGYERFEKGEIKLVEGEEFDFGEVRLVPAPLLKVTVLDAATKKPVPDAMVITGPLEWKDNLRSRSLEPKDDFYSESLRGAPTNEQGIALLELTADKDILIAAGASGYARYLSSTQHFKSEEAAAFTVHLAKGGEVVVTVFDDRNEPIPGVTVLHYRFREESTEESWVQIRPEWRSDEAGQVRFSNLESGEYGFRVYEESGDNMNGYVTLSADAEWMRLQVEDGSEQTLALTSFRRSTLHGTVRENGSILEGALLTLIEMENGEIVDDMEHMMFFGFGGEDSGESISDSKGRYRFEDVKPGEYTLRVSHATRVMDSDVVVNVMSDPTRFDVDLAITVLEGTVVDEAGNPIEGVSVAAYSQIVQPYSSWRPGGLQVREDEEGGTLFEMNPNSIGGQMPNINDETDRSGHYSLRGVRPDETMTLHASARFYQSKSIECPPMTPGELRDDLDFVLSPAGILSVSVTGLTDEDNYAHVVAEYIDEGESKGATHTTSVSTWSPTVELDSLRPGRWIIRLSKQDGPIVFEEERTIEAGEITEISVDL